MRMEVLQSQRVELMVGIAFALVAVGAGTAYYFYLSNKNKPKETSLKPSKKAHNLVKLGLLMDFDHLNMYVYTLAVDAKCCLDPENFKKFKLVKRTQLSHNVAKFRFDLPTPTSVLGLPIGQHMSCRGKDSQGDVIKPYTPTTLDSDVGYFELVIKMYPQGRMSHHFREMREGDYLAMKGPKGRFKYQPGQVRAFGMLAGGTGITPMFQVARAILENPNDKTNINLIYANDHLKDDGGVGFVSKEMIQAHCPAPASDIQILRCGPPPMNKAMAAHLEALGYASQMQFQF
ncbi:unnamed protein product [Camellia sinensis]